VRREAERRLGARVVRATRTYGGYAPSATFRLLLSNRRRAFFKASYPPPAGSGVRWVVDREEKRYRSLQPMIARWSPRFYGSFKRDDWHVLLMQDLGPATMPPWTASKTARAARSYARFHRTTLGKALPRWLPRTQHAGFGGFWDLLARSGELSQIATLARGREDEALEWIDVVLPIMRDLERGLARARRPFALLHFDTRSDNVRLIGDRLFMFDWPFACAGPIEFDVAAFAQAITAEGGPSPERVLESYESVLALRPRELDASLAGLAGYFADRTWRPPVPGLPRLRSIQRRQLKAMFAWSARRFGLPEPRWLRAVAD
jgi:hypothetical protein